MASDEKDNDADVTPPKSKLVPALLILNTFLVVGVLAFTVLRKPPAAAPAAEAHAAEGEGEGEHGEKKEGEHGAEGGAMPAGRVGPTLALENIVVQLRALDAERYAHIALEIEVGDEKDKEIVASFIPRIREAVISYLADRTADELRGSQGMNQLKDEISRRLDAMIAGRRIKNLFVTNFIVQ